MRERATQMSGSTEQAPSKTARVIEKAKTMGFVGGPTPLQHLEKLSDYLAGPQIWMKRDDLTVVGGGGNKTRKLELLIADALLSSADVILTAGGIQSNHARQTAAACTRFGLRCELFLQATAYSDDWYLHTGNVLLDRLFLANLHGVDRDQDLYSAMVDYADQLAAEGHKPYVIPYGGSNPLGAVGYALAAEEILDQCRDRDMTPGAIFMAMGSGGTQAGLAAGFGSTSDIRVVGVAVAPDAVSDREVSDLAESTATLMGKHGIAPLEFDWNQAGTPYGVPTEEATAAIGLLARIEGVLLEPVYTAKAMAAMISWIETNRLDSSDVIFVHTGGGPGLFAYQNHLDEWLSETAPFGERTALLPTR